MQVINGIGKLYGADGTQIISANHYQIWHEPQTEYTFEDWSGNLTVDHVIWPLADEYIIELEDQRRGKVVITELHLQSGQTIYNYRFQGSGSLA